MKLFAQKLKWKPSATQAIIGVLALVLLGMAIPRIDVEFRAAADEVQTVNRVERTEHPMTAHDKLPDEADFELVAESESLALKFDSVSGHFIVHDRRSGHVWRSYPEPEHWENEGIGGIWKDHLRSPFMLRYTDFAQRQMKPKDTNFISAGGRIQEVKRIDGGIRVDYELPELGLVIPVQIRIGDDYVETTILDESLKEQNFSLIWVRLFPFLGGVHSVGQEGYLFIPDGSGALISFNKPEENQTRTFQGAIYGEDPSFINGMERSRQPISMPVYGVKSGDKAVLAIVTEGEEYGEIVASPAGVYSQYNWITIQNRYRSTFLQITNRSRESGFAAYNEDQRFAANRSVRYYFLEGDESDYVGMAARYRQYLLEEDGYSRIEASDGNLPLHLTIVGADRQSGLVTDSYLPTTTTAQAMQIVQRLYGLGVEKMQIQYTGWQNDGYSSYGGYDSVDRRLGGGSGMKKFIDYAHSLGFPVMLGADYTLNNTGEDGFSERHHAVRNMSGTTLRDAYWSSNDASLVSLQRAQHVMENDMAFYKELGVDGIVLGGIGSRLASDFNTRYGGTRTESKQLQQRMADELSEQFPLVGGNSTNNYVNASMDHIYHLASDYSYDVFSDRAVPFAQIALHGLVSYSSSYANQRDEYHKQFLKDIEYGAVPSFILTHDESEKLRFAYGIQLFSSEYANWASPAVKEYQRYNMALGDVQDQYIVDHRQLADGVFATTYSGGKSVIVNYNRYPYAGDGIRVGAEDFTVVQGGADD
ncbi:DUF5696 domain-containing protein [Paenibacillus sp. J5C_2022]|uniref:DUF5696 domain-containing protein n=1 Tax=Paenibacillus sp. J5C2022 TaxID=2977129 RepID=UPI0021D26D32|nr:DUF5696 domain-containing protein [Paenibacillus sp. J5C2022]MCU6710204.1 DUF5696 domain-containing protein [Paenibacillus sp. J5C2022]